MAQYRPMHGQNVGRKTDSSRWKPKTLLEVLGKDRIVIEHHKGILAYSTEQILIKTTYGILRIQGNGLTVCCMRREQLCIVGTVDELELQGRNADGTVE